jgi:hypothetical protein
MKDILLVLALLACPLSMLAMGAVAWASAKLDRGRREPTTTHQPGGAG